jgi:RHS repeat-associated protein
MGWSLNGILHVTRSTRDGLPRYEAAEPEDVFNLSGAEDLVPVYERDASGNLVLNDGVKKGSADYKIKEEQRDDRFLVREYRPRIEGLYSRIERWTDQFDPEDVHWRIFSAKNELTILGRDDNSRICSLEGGQKRTFSWLCCEWYDCYGNARLYEYKKENSEGVDLAQANEQNRTEDVRGSQRHLKRIKYGNRKPVADRSTMSSPLSKPFQPDWMFEVVFDYKEHDWNNPEPTESQGKPWACRRDPFSSFKSGFEIRTYRLCKRVLMFHHFPDPEELGQQDYLVKALEIEYQEGHAITYIKSFRRAGYVLRGANDPPSSDSEKGSPYFVKRLPPLVLEYTQLPSEDVMKALVVQEVDDEASLENVPEGVQSSYQWLDLLGEGITGILFAGSDDEWYYKANLSAANEYPIVQANVDPMNAAPSKMVKPKFGPMQKVRSKPSLRSSEGSPELLDLEGDGRLCLTIKGGLVPGFYRSTADPSAGVTSTEDVWESFRSFPSWPNIDMKDPNLRMIDVTGDGKADILISQDNIFVWYQSMGEQGFVPTSNTVNVALSEEKGPRILFSDATETVHLADLNGDGMVDIVRVRNGNICYWPNMGYGRFGAKVAMDNAPFFDASDSFSSQRLILGDIDGSGTTDLIYFGDNIVTIYHNLAGNSWSDPVHIESWPMLTSGVTVAAIDLLGAGTMCLVWSSSHPSDENGRSLRYVDLSGGQKPHLLSKVTTNMGKETRFIYRPSTTYYLDDLAAGRPWATRLPFPQHCVDRVITYDHISKVSLSQHYSYHHGYYDSVEREFRGFGMVEQWDTEQFNSLDIPQDAVNHASATHVPPIHTKSWFHTGAFTDHEKLSRAYANEYFGSPNPLSSNYSAALEEFFKSQLRDTLSFEGFELSIDELREASRALKGSVLRSEVYADDGTSRAGLPYQIVDTGNAVRLLQPRGTANQHAVFLTYAQERLTYHIERNPDDPRIEHTVTLKVDDFGNVGESATVCYGRRKTGHVEVDLEITDIQRQQAVAIIYAENDVTNTVLESENYRVPQLSRQRKWEAPELAGLDEALGRYTPSQLAQIKDFHEIPFEQALDPHSSSRRLIEHVETAYRPDNLGEVLDIGKQQALGLPGVSYRLCLTSSMVKKVFKRDDQSLISDPSNIGGYTDRNSKTSWWIPSPQVFYHPDQVAGTADELSMAKKSFFIARRVRDEFGINTITRPDSHFLQIVQIQDELGNVTVGELDYRTLQMRTVTDPNRNRTQVKHDALGIAVGFATMGKDGERLGDTLDGFNPNLRDEEICAYFLDPRGNAAHLLAGATSRLIYDVDAYRNMGSDSPTWASKISREVHHFARVSDTAEGKMTDTKTNVSVSYTDGYQREIQVKTQAESALWTPKTLRWRGTGWSVFNNKGSPVQQFEPFFDNSHQFHSDRREGVSSILLYDPLERPIGMILPNKTWRKQIRSPWQITVWDCNDTITTTITDDKDLGAVVKHLPADTLLPSWFESRISGHLGKQEQKAAKKAAAHADTPSVSYYDVLGRPFLNVKDNGLEGKIKTRAKYDIQGNAVEIRDGFDRVVTTQIYSMCGQNLCSTSADFGTRWILLDVHGKLLHRWDSRGFHVRTEYDELRRPTATYVQRAEGEALTHKMVYGEKQSSPQAHNLRGKLFREYDQAGIVTQGDWDFKGNSLVVERQYATEYKSTVDWRDISAVKLEPDVREMSWTFDALNRVVTTKTPDDSVVKNTFNEGGFLDSVSAHLKGEQTATVFVSSSEYDAYGRNIVQTAGNNTVTTNSYDALTKRLINRRTVRQQGRASKVVQDLKYTYDPVGNVILLQNDAEQSVFFRNGSVKPHSQYTYDAIYRLVKAKGREDVGRTKGRPFGPGTLTSQVTLDLAAATPDDGSAMVRYVEQYTYDAANNMTAIHHQFKDPKFAGWTRRFSYDTASDQRVSNRLISTTIGNVTEKYAYDAHGNMTSMAHLSKIQWDYENQMRSSSTQKVNNGTPETTWYVYDAQGQRVRKVTERHAATVMASSTKLSERLTLDGFEIYRQYAGDGTRVTQQCESLHVTGIGADVAIVEDWSSGAAGSFRLTRFQLHDRLRSIGVELDETGMILSYEEFVPFGSTSYKSSLFKAPKRFRYVSKERDSENGLYYVGLRYYIPWLARWLNPDPIGIGDGLNVFEYAASNPLRYRDPHGTSRQDTNDMKKALGKSSSAVSPSATSSAATTSSGLSSSASSAAPRHTGDFSSMSGSPKIVGISSRQSGDYLGISLSSSSSSFNSSATSSASLWSRFGFGASSLSHTSPSPLATTDALKAAMDAVHVHHQPRVNIHKGDLEDTRSSLHEERLIYGTLVESSKEPLTQEQHESIQRASDKISSK